MGDKNPKAPSKLMKIPLTKIPQAGLKLSLTTSEPWFDTLMSPYFNDPLIQINKDSLRGELQLTNHDGEVDIKGRLDFVYDAACARCGEPLHKKQNLVWNVHLSPWQNTSKSNLTEEEENEIELTASDLNFAFYKNDEIDLHPILNDEIALGFPYNHYCADSKTCEARFQQNLQTAQVKTTDPRWDALKAFKGKS